jgi:drug/metabolite transporter (DMT)-like permease
VLAIHPLPALNALQVSRSLILSLVRRMEPTSYTAKVVRTLLFAVIIFVPLSAYQIAHAPPQARRAKIIAVIGALVAGIVIAVLSVRQRRLSPENPRLPPSTLVGITLVLIIVAILTRHL